MRNFSFSSALLGLLTLLIAFPLSLGCATRTNEISIRAESKPYSSAVVIGPEEGTELWFAPTSAEELGDGSLLKLKVDHVRVPHANMTVMTQRLGRDGIPIHLHTFEDEILYVLSGTGSAIVGEDREEVAVEPGSTIYIPQGEWHGVINADPGERIEVLIVTTPSAENGLADFFRNASVKPGHPPLTLPPDEFLALFGKYGMEVPAP